jgi:predicted phosphodiesterase
MKIQVLSDIHLEFLKRVPEFPILGDHLILAGDIGYAGSPNWYRFLRDCQAKYKKVFYVAGNHEFYGGSYSDRMNVLRSDDIGITFLEKDYIDIDGTDLRIMGTTLWTDVPVEEMYSISQIMSDYKKIRCSGRQLKVDDTNYFHRQARSYLDAQINKCSEDGKKAIVITHHLPSFQMVSAKYRNENNYGFASDCDALIRDPVKLWVCGHSHTQMERDINDVKVVMASLGYPSEVRDNIPKLCSVEISDEYEVNVSWH